MKRQPAILRRLSRRISGFRLPTAILCRCCLLYTSHAAELSREAERLGADALLHVTPYYNKTSQEGLYRHFRACAEASHLPIILYNVPSRTGVNIRPETYRRLSDIDNLSLIHI